MPFFSFNGIIPDLILILVIFFTIKNNQFYGTIIGFLSGVVSDLTFGTLLGSSMIAKTLSGFIAGYFSSENKREIYLNPHYFGIIVLFIAIIHNAVFLFFSSIEISKNFFASLLISSIPNSIYTSIVSIIIIFSLPKKRRFD